MAGSFRAIRLRRYLRKWPGATWRQFRGDFFNVSQAIALGGIWFAIYLYSFWATEEQVAEEVSFGIAGLYAVVGVAFVWGLWAAIASPFRIHSEEKAKGTLIGNRFIYHEPPLVATFRCKPTGDVEMYKFKLKDVEPGAFVYCRIALDGAAHLAMVDLGGTALSGPIPHLPERRWGFLLPKSREAIFRIQLPLDAIAITARIYCENFIVGEPDDEDGTTGNYQFPVRPPVGGNGIPGRLLARKRKHQAVKHQVRHLTHVPAILKLPQILRKMLPTDVNVGAVDPAL
jgi:hypothetical protein